MKHTHRYVIAACAAAATVLLVAAPAVLARQADAGRAGASAAPSASASGEVRRVDPAAGRVTIKHGEIPGLGLAAMTLVYRADPALLANIKPGQKVRFTATLQDKRYVITQIE